MKRKAQQAVPTVEGLADAVAAAKRQADARTRSIWQEDQQARGVVSTTGAQIDYDGSCTPVFAGAASCA